MPLVEQVWRVDTIAGPATSGSGKRVRRAALVYHEPDERFHLALWRSRSGGDWFSGAGRFLRTTAEIIPACGFGLCRLA